MWFHSRVTRLLLAWLDKGLAIQGIVGSESEIGYNLLNVKFCILFRDPSEKLKVFCQFHSLAEHETFLENMQSKYN